MQGPRRIGELDWWIADGIDPDALAPRLAHAFDAWRAGALRNRKSGRRKALYALAPDAAAAGAGAAAGGHLLKVTRYGAWDGLRLRPGGSKARRELARAEAVAARGLPTPVPQAAGEWRRAGRLRACLLLVPVLEGAVDLRAWLDTPQATPPARRRLARRFGALARRVADAGVFQDDFAPNNFLVAPGADAPIQLIDFERARLRRTVSAAGRHFMLAKLHRELPGASAAERLRFLHGWAGDRAAAHRLWRALAPAIAELAVRDLRRMGRTATRPGRRFGTLRHGAARGFRYGDDPVALQLAETPGAPGVEGVGGHWCVRRDGVGPRHARSLWVRQAWLAARGLAAPPRALLVHPGGRAVLVLRREPSDRLAETPGAAPRAARAVLWARTLALGELAPAAVPGEPLVWRDDGPTPRARWLLVPASLRVRGRADPAGPERARRIARGGGDA